MRFVIQEHHTDPLHWDLMLEREGVLRTWSLAAPPPEGPFEIDALQHFDHRILYLEYEGAVSGNRGRVRIWDRGYFEASWGEKRILLSLSGMRLTGAFDLEFLKSGHRSAWVFRRS